MGSVKLTDVTKVYGGNQPVPAVEDVNLEINDGEFIVMVGPSGCGKSTTLRMVAGLEDITAGTIDIDGTIVNETKTQDRDIAMVFQNYALYPHMSVHDNLAFSLRLSGEYESNEIDRMVRKTAELLEIEELLDQLPKQLSGGQQQRVALGRAIIRDPVAFLMDEPLSNLDAKLRTQMRTELQRIQSDLGVTTIYVTHDQTEAMTMGDRIVILNNGTIQQVASPKECYDKPANRFVAGFIGSPSMNFFDVSVEDSDGRTVVSGDGIKTAFDNVSLSPGDYTLGIRPEDFRVVENSGAAEASVDVVEPMGSDNYLYLQMDDETEFTVRTDSDRLPNEGERVNVAFAATDVHFFEKTGKRIDHVAASEATF